ncbi:MAG: hypothetical protein HQ575_03175 [Candidatus Omnitrophica bacterium]|nr:hypothetical protein [Candidatus Omnitrophota bacterium]
MFKIIAMLIFLAVSVQAPVYISVQAEEYFIYDQNDNRDPFIPLITKGREKSTRLSDVRTADDITLEGIAWDPGGSSIAVINNVIVVEGQEEGDVKIKKIEKKSVTLIINGVETQVGLVKKGENYEEE